MAGRIRWTPHAVADLAAVRGSISLDSVAAANKVVVAIRDMVRTLRDHPFRGHLVPEFEPRQLRQVVVYSYRVIHRVRDGVVEILGIVHGARDLPALWDREGRPTSGGDTPDTSR